MTREEKNAVNEEQQRQMASDRELRLRIEASNSGRSGGWFVEFKGERIAELTEPKWDDMFWVLYRITPLTEDPAIRALLETPDFWWSDDVVCRSREFGFIAPFAFGSGRGPSDGWISMRGLYLNFEVTEGSRKRRR
jgi:hypothetical protein